MKKLSFYTFITTASLIVPTFSSPSWAKECPIIPKNIQKLTVNDKAATLRKEAKYDPKNKGPEIKKDDPLTVISYEPQKGLGQNGKEYCWYKVSPVNNDQKYWIADVWITEFQGFPIAPKTPSPATIQNTQQEASIPLQLHLVLILSGLGIIINALILLLFYSELEKILHYLNLPSFLKNQKRSNNYRSSMDNDNFREQIQSIISEQLSQSDLSNIKIKLDQIFKDLGVENKKTNLSSVSPNFPIDTYKNKDNVIDSSKQTTKKTLSQILEKLEIIIDKQEKSNTWNDANEVKINEISKLIHQLSQRISQDKEVDVTPEQISQKFQDADSNSSLPTSSEMSPKLTELVNQFNYQNSVNDKDREPFNQERFQPLKLTQQSTQGQVGLNAHRILELEMCTDNSQASYLKFEMDGENWLIPNITSSYISQIMRNLDENRDIFIIHPGLGTLQLLRPAKLKNIGSNLWGIEEPGEFTQQQ